ncbi:MAG: transcription antitermination factor NusB [Clostridiaceae bacterium]|nr:transcription antitermination factor NusB [Clostridiaceae bacterium]
MSRKRSREKAMELAFGMELSKETPAEVLEMFIESDDLNQREFDIEYIKKVLEGITENKESLDNLIKENLQNWKIERVAKINLTILRLGILEMKYFEDVPGKVAVNEALELAKKYSDEKSVSFINGVLDKILKA